MVLSWCNPALSLATKLIQTSGVTPLKKVATAVSAKISPERVGFRVSPYNKFNDLQVRTSICEMTKQKKLSLAESCNQCTEHYVFTLPPYCTTLFALKM